MTGRARRTFSWEAPSLENTKAMIDFKQSEEQSPYIIDYAHSTFAAGKHKSKRDKC